MRRASLLLSLGVTALVATSARSVEDRASVAAPAVAAVAAVAPVPVAAPAALAPVVFGGDCCACDSITSNFNGTKIPPGSWIWLNAVVNVKGRGTNDATVGLCDVDVDCTVGDKTYYVELPKAVIVFSDDVTEARSDFDCATRMWTTRVPSSYSGNVFLTGMALYVKHGAPGGIKPVVMNACFGSDLPGVSFEWKWAAAVYSSFPDCEDDLGVKPVDGDKFTKYLNSDHAGTPENFKSFVIGGARGGGGSNFTGSYSGTSTAQCE